MSALAKPWSGSRLPARSRSPEDGPRKRPNKPTITAARCPRFITVHTRSITIIKWASDRYDRRPVNLWQVPGVAPEPF